MTSRFAVPLFLSVATLLAAPLAHAQGDSTVAPFYFSQVFSGMDWDGLPNYTFPQEVAGERTVSSNIAPTPVVSASGFLTGDAATFSGRGQTVYSGWYASRNFAEITVNNAQTDETYYTVAGFGTTTTVRFFDPSAAAASAVYHWTVSGTSSAQAPNNTGVATGRLDFGASTTQVDWFDLFTNADPNNVLDSRTWRGVGDYTYTIPTPLDTNIYLYYWSSAYAEVTPGDVPAGSSFTMTANYSNTFVLTGIELFDANGNVLTTPWQMVAYDPVNNIVGPTLFNETGRIALIDPAPDLPPVSTGNVPLPGTLALVGLGLLGLGAARRPRVSAPA